jgi:catechol 2,3-dioxygenase-like lactoylglutathione lyase family enzyme
MPFSIKAIDHVVINVSDVERSAAWYQRVLGMTREDFAAKGARAPGQPKRTALKFGSQKINLRPIDADTDDWFTAEHASTGSDDLCFLTDAPPEAVAEHLKACGVAIELGPVEKQGARGPIRSVYCRDPDGSLIEISSYPT